MVGPIRMTRFQRQHSQRLNMRSMDLGTPLAGAAPSAVPKPSCSRHKGEVVFGPLTAGGGGEGAAGTARSLQGAQPAAD